MDRLDALLLAAADYDRRDPKRIQHFIKVHALSALIGRQEGLTPAALAVLEAAAILHDIGIHAAEEKYGSCGGKLQEQEGPPVARALLAPLPFTAEETEDICWLIAHHHTYSAITRPDHRILVEADFLVNLYEDGASTQVAEAAYRAVFRTDAGRALCRTMFGLAP